MLSKGYVDKCVCRRCPITKLFVIMMCTPLYLPLHHEQQWIPSLMDIVDSVDDTKNEAKRECKKIDLDKDELTVGFENLHYGIISNEAIRKLKRYGKNFLPEKVTPKWYNFFSQLWQPIPIIIWIAASIEAGLANYPDLAILLFIQFANASIGYYEITKAGDLVLLATGSAIPVDCRVNEEKIEVDQAQLTGESLPVSMGQGYLLEQFEVAKNPSQDNIKPRDFTGLFSYALIVIRIS
eukprot:gene8262-17004_t